VADAVRGILDGHIVMERAIAERGRYPAASNVLKSVSRSMPRSCDPAYRDVVKRARGAMATFFRHGRTDPPGRLSGGIVGGKWMKRSNFSRNLRLFLVKARKIQLDARMVTRRLAEIMAVRRSPSTASRDVRRPLGCTGCES
jgi:hypothetical protein